MSRLAWITPPTIPTASVMCRRLIIPNDPVLVAAVNGALLLLIDPRNWEQIGGTVAPEDAAAAMQAMYFEYLRESAFCMIGAIVAVATETAPEGTLLCDGSAYARADYPRLYAALPPALIVDADTFTVPDLRDRFILGAGTTPAHDTGGAATVTLTVEQLPRHTHTANPHTHTANPHTHGNDPHTHTDSGHTHGESVAAPSAGEIGPGVPFAYAIPAAGVTGPGFASITPSVVTVLPETVTLNETTVTVNDAGDSEAHNNMPPFYALVYVIVAR